MPDALTGEETVKEMIARVTAAKPRKPYSGNPDAADPELDRRLVALSAAGHNPPDKLSQRDLRRWADLAERRLDAERLSEEQDAEEEQWAAEQAAGHADAEAAERAKAEARAEAKALVDRLAGGSFGGAQ